VVLAEQSAEIAALKAAPRAAAAPAIAGVEPVAHVEGGAAADPEAALKSAYEAEVAAGRFHLSFETYKAMAKGLAGHGRK